MSTDVLLPKMR